MPMTLRTGLCLCYLFGSLSTVKCGSSEVNATCSAQPAVEGQTGAIQLYFNGIDFSAHQFYIVLQKNSTTILLCGDYVTPAVTTCKIRHDSFQYEGKANQNMTVIIPVVTHDLGGTFELYTQINKTFLNATSCTIQVVHALIEPVHIVGVVVPTVLVIIVVVAVVVIVIIVVRRRHHHYRTTSSQEDAQTSAIDDPVKCSSSSDQCEAIAL